jgi:ankyrin repeat protein
MTVILAWPLAVLVAGPLVRGFRDRSSANAEARIGDFRDPTLASMAEAIRTDNTTILTRLLNGQPPPDGKDRAGNDLLAYALLHLRDRRGRVGPVRVLLDAGADPRRSRLGTGEDVLNFMVLGITPEGREAVRLLLEHGADPNIVDPTSGDTPLRSVSGDPAVVRMLVEHGAKIDQLQSGGITALIHFISTREWDTALYLIEKGANLDVVNEHGLSVDYYLKDWRESVYGEHPEGWDKVRAAIAVRRTAPAR